MRNFNGNLFMISLGDQYEDQCQLGDGTKECEVRDCELHSAPNHGFELRQDLSREGKSEGKGIERMK